MPFQNFGNRPLTRTVIYLMNAGVNKITQQTPFQARQRLRASSDFTKYFMKKTQFTVTFEARLSVGFGLLAHHPTAQEIDLEVLITDHLPDARHRIEYRLLSVASIG
jgi:hypothetical protein